MEDAFRTLLKNTGWLYTVVYQNSVFFWDLWSFIHLYAGILLMAALIRARVRRPGAWLVGILIGYELYESVLHATSLHVFRTEVPLDTLYDVIVGCAAGAATWWGVPALQRASVRKNGDFVVVATAGVFAAMWIAFDWVGFYTYTYSAESRNTFRFNWWAFALWASGLTAVLFANTLLKRRLPSPVTRLPLVMAAYAIGVLALERAGDVLFGIHELQGDRDLPFLFGVNHGSGASRLFSCVAGLGVILGQDLVERFVGIRARGEAARAAPVALAPTSS